MMADGEAGQAAGGEAPPAGKGERDRACAGLAAALSAFALGADLPEVKGETRGSARAAFARQVAMYLSHVAFEMSLARVAAAFRRDRSTVAHACHLMEDKRDDTGFDAWLEALETAARAAPPPLLLAMAS